MRSWVLSYVFNIVFVFNQKQNLWLDNKFDFFVCVFIFCVSSLDETESKLFLQMEPGCFKESSGRSIFGFRGTVASPDTADWIRSWCFRANCSGIKY